MIAIPLNPHPDASCESGPVLGPCTHRSDPRDFQIAAPQTSATPADPAANPGDEATDNQGAKHV